MPKPLPPSKSLGLGSGRITVPGGLSLGGGSLGLGSRTAEADPDEALELHDYDQAKVKKLDDAFEEMRNKVKHEQRRFDLVNDSEFWCCFCFETREQKEEFLMKLGLIELGDKYVDGLAAAEKLNVKLESPRADFPKHRQNRSLARFALR